MIKEMQDLKVKYPEYKNIPDSELLKLVAAKYPEFQPKLDKYQVEEAQRSSFSTALKDEGKAWLDEGERAIERTVEPSSILKFLNPAFSTLKPEALKQLMGGVLEETGEHLERPMGAMRGLVAGEKADPSGSLIKGGVKSFKAGWKDPTKQPTMGESVLKAYPEKIQILATGLLGYHTRTQAGKDMANFLGIEDVEAQGLIAGTVGTLAEMGSLHVLYSTLPKAAIQATKAIKGSYTTAQGKALARLIEQLTKEFEPIMGKAKAGLFARVKVYQEWLKPGWIKKTPIGINKITQGFKQNEGKMAEVLRKVKQTQAMERAAGEATREAARETQRGVAGVQESWNYKPGTLISNIEKLKQPSISRARASEIIVPKSELLDANIKAQADRFLSGVTFEQELATPSGAKIIIKDPKTQNTFAIPKAEVTQERVLDCLAKQKVQESPETPKSPETQIEYPEQQLNLEQQKVFNQAKKFLNDSGFIHIPDYKDCFIDIQGSSEIAIEQVKRLAKRFGIPFWIGEKYPAFKPIYNAISEANYEKIAHFVDGAEILNPREHLKLPPQSQQRVVDALVLGNTPDVRAEYTPENLRLHFGFTDKEVTGYKSLRNLYEYTNKIILEEKQLLHNYIEMTPEQKQDFDSKMMKQIRVLDGYLNQKRLEGKWAVYTEPKPGSEVREFFQIYNKKSQAKKAAEEYGGRVYLRKDLRSFYNHMTLSDLESLIEASGIDARSPDSEALRAKIQERTFSAHWIKRRDVPQGNRSLAQLYESGIDYLEGAVNRLARIKGQMHANKAFQATVKNMSPDLQAYTRDWIDAYYNTGAVGYQAFNRLIYAWRLAFKSSWLAQNFTQPVAVTLPYVVSKQGFVKGSATFLRAYRDTMEYATLKLKKKKSNLDPKLITYLDLLHKQGALGDQLTRFQLGIAHLKESEFDKQIGLFGRIGEYTNRTNAAICGYHVAVEQELLKDPRVIMARMKDTVHSTQFAYGKMNLPLIITSAKDLSNVLRTMYTFKHYQVNYLHFLASMNRKSKKGFMTSLGILLAQAGLKGAPFAALIDASYKKIMGRSMWYDMKKGMKELGMKDRAIDCAIHGGWSLTGVDASNLVGAGDMIPTYGSGLEKVGGAAVGFGMQLTKGMQYFMDGDRRWMEYMSPDVLKNILKGVRYAREGIRNANNELVAMPSTKDAILRGLGFSPMIESDAWEAREAKNLIRTNTQDLSANLHKKLAWALYKKDTQGYKKLTQEAGSKNIRINISSIKDYMLRIQGINLNVPKKHVGEFSEIDKLYNIKKTRK